MLLASFRAFLYLRSPEKNAERDCEQTVHVKQWWPMLPGQAHPQDLLFAIAHSNFLQKVFHEILIHLELTLKYTCS